MLMRELDLTPVVIGHSFGGKVALSLLEQGEIGTTDTHYWVWDAPPRSTELVESDDGAVQII